MDTESGRVRELVKEKSVTMEYFLETSHLDATTAEMLKKYDKDGNGSFSKDEVVAIVLDLREAMQSNELLGASNKMFKRLFLAATTFSLLLLTSIFGLSYAVAALTRNTDVRSDGLMLTRDGTAVIATDSTAKTYSVGPDANGEYCLPITEAMEMAGGATEGRNVLMQVGDYEGQEGRTHTFSIGASGFETNENGFCVWNAELSQQSCFTYVEDGPCEPRDSTGRRKLVGEPTGQRKLVGEPASSEVLDEFRRLQEAETIDYAWVEENAPPCTPYCSNSINVWACLPCISAVLAGQGYVPDSAASFVWCPLGC